MPFFWLILLALNTFWLVYNLQDGNAFMATINAIGAAVSLAGLIRDGDDW